MFINFILYIFYKFIKAVSENCEIKNMQCSKSNLVDFN